jgi:signal transduction histidine kinase
MNIDFFIVIFCTAISAALGFLVLLRNWQLPRNRRFALLAASLILWTLFNYMSDHEPATNRWALWYTRLAFFGGVLAIYSVLDFIANFPKENAFSKSAVWKVETAATLVMLPIVLLPGFVSSISGGSFTGTINTSYLYNLYIIYVVYSFSLFVFMLWKQNHMARLFQQKQQIHLISWGVGLYAVLSLTSNVLIPAVYDSWSSSRFGPAATLLFLGVVAYSIVKHRLFNIRPVIARSAAYALTLGLITAVFSVLVFGFVGIVRDTRFSTTFQRVFYVTLTVILILVYPPLKRFFDKQTNKLFYRDFYDPQMVIDRLSSLLVGTVEVKKIEVGSARILADTLRPMLVKFLLFSEQSGEIDPLLHELANRKRDVIVFDELESQSHSGLQEKMSKRNIAVAAKLKTPHEDLGFMLLGFKQSGGLYTDDDLGLIGIVADEIAISLQNAIHFEEIQRFNVTLQEKIDDATKQLRHANSRLKQLDQTKDEFISMASHQLRTPLTTIKGYLSMVLEGDVGPVTKNEKQMIQQAFDSAERMVFLIGDLLNVSRLQSGKFVIDNKPTDLIKMVKTEVEQLKDTAEHHGLKLICNTPDKLPLFNLDDTKIRQVVMNFMDNAIYYTPAGGTITVNLEANPDTISYTVVDTGLGVPKEEQHHLFTKFYRAGNARKMRPDGTGLGLFMAKKVIVAQGGAIIFKSEEGKGSTFGFSFPRHKIEIKGKPPEKQPAAAVAA